MTESSKIWEAIGALGATPDEIAASLGRKRCKGRRADEQACPLAIYLKRRLRGMYELSVTAECVLIKGSDAPAIGLPKVAAEFIRGFDRGKYPELVRKRPRT